MDTSTTEYRSEQLEKTLRVLHAAVPGIKASVVVNLDGLLVSAYPSDDTDEGSHNNPTGSPQVAAMSATLVGLAIRVLKRLEQGELKRLLMEAEEGQMVVYPAGESLLAVLVEKDTKLGKVIYAASRATADITEILGFAKDNDKKS
ncbi:MAG: hypothetical protein GYB66_02780 [Chloroflexi bacterium]|jgi:predicted regulator of Ras-like GTPase activity (Roadblock/LC7/MglB family)|nr:hypothetical protein [Chloroflexota bacterium]